jgi:mono/diheme cytochrome c family protein
MARGFMMLVVAAIVLAPLTARAQDAAKGQEVFAAQKCSICHSVAGKGNPKGSLDGVASKYSAEELRQWIVDAKGMAAKTKAERKPPMKDFSSLPKADVDNLVAYLQTLKK